MPAKSLRASFSRPPLADILAYRAHVDAAIARLLEAAPEFPANAEAARRIVLGLHHEQQHQELIATDIKHALFTNPLHPAYLPPPPTACNRRHRPAARLDRLLARPHPDRLRPGHQSGCPIGVTSRRDVGQLLPSTTKSPRHSVFLAPFALATRLVTCAEYLAFMDDNGYTRPELWLSEGWATLREQGWQAPLYWQRDPANPSGWRIFTLHGWQALDALSEDPCLSPQLL